MTKIVDVFIPKKSISMKRGQVLHANFWPLKVLRFIVRPNFSLILLISSEKLAMTDIRTDKRVIP